MDTPQANPEGYEECNLNNLAKNLKGHLLIIHDDNDHTCVLQHTLSFMKACIILICLFIPDTIIM